MAYVLECQNEFERLEKQSNTEGYDFKDELSDIVSVMKAKGPKRILDAGCGSGIVSRYLAQTFQGAEVVGCDISGERVAQAAEVSHGQPRLNFVEASLDKLPFPTNHFDLIVCRYVMQHLNPEVRRKALVELFRCLKMGGTLRIVDMDGTFFNIHPSSPALEKSLAAIFENENLDMHIGRKLPKMLRQAGFHTIDWKIKTLNFRGKLMETEIQLNTERFGQMQGFMEKILSSKKAVSAFVTEFMAAMKDPDAVLFYNKFLIDASKGQPELVKR